MKLFASAAALSVALLGASAVQAQDYYSQIDLGLVAAGSTDITADMSGLTGSMNADSEIGLLVGGLVGKQMKDGFAVEGEMVFAHNSMDTAELDAAVGEELDAKVSATLLMLNGKYTFKTDKAWAPYIGAGVGYGQVRYELLDAEESDNGVAWQAKVGLTYKQSDTQTWDFGYRYVQAPEFVSKDGSDSLTMETGFHALSVGMRFGF